MAGVVRDGASLTGLRAGGMGNETTLPCARTASAPTSDSTASVVNFNTYNSRLGDRRAAWPTSGARA